jgi:hypothetical protein
MQGAGNHILNHVRACSEAHQTSYPTDIKIIFPRGLRDWSLKLTIHHHLALKSRLRNILNTTMKCVRSKRGKELRALVGNMCTLLAVRLSDKKCGNKL